MSHGATMVATSCARRFSLAAICFMVLAPMLAPSMARAQTQEPQAAAPPAAPAANSELFDFLDDIDKLNVIVPLHMTTEQLGKLIDLIKTGQANYDEKVAKLAASFTSKLGADIRRVHASALLGNNVPEDFLVQVNDVLKERTALQTEYVRFVTSGLTRITDDSQQATIVSLAKKYAGSGRGDNAQWINYYVLNVLLRYPRIIPMLKQARAAQDQDQAAKQPAQ